MLKLCTLVFFSGFLFSAAVLLAQNASSDSCSNPAEVSKMVNPVKPSPESIALGKKYYGYDCAMCHGANGNGKGDIDTGEKLLDFTNPDSLKDKSDGELYCSLKVGKGHMPLEPVRTAAPNNLWNLINYVRSLSK